MSGEGPSLIEEITYRLTAHSSDDDDRSYRDHQEVEEAKKHDSLITFAAYLTDRGILTEENSKAMHAEIDEMINKATDYAENAAYADPESALKFVYEERSEEHTSELQSRGHLVCRLLLEQKKKQAAT